MTVFNFSPGPAVLPKEVLQRAAAEMLDWHGSGMSVMEMSHRGSEFISIADKAEADLRKLMSIGDDYEVLFLQGGAIGENAIVPMNLLGDRKVIDFINTGEWSKKSIKEAKKYAQVQHRRFERRRELRLCAGAHELGAVAQCGVRTRLHQRDDRRRRIPLDAGRRQGAAGGRHVVAHSVASDRCVEVRRDLRRRAEKRRSRGSDAGHRAQGSARPCARDHAIGVQLEGTGGKRFDAEHAADLRCLHRRDGVRVVVGARRVSRDRTEKHRQGEAAVRRH